MFLPIAIVLFGLTTAFSHVDFAETNAKQVRVDEDKLPITVFFDSVASTIGRKDSFAPHLEGMHTEAMTEEPTEEPTGEPTTGVTPSTEPTEFPTALSSVVPSIVPSTLPTAVPTTIPTETPSVMPSQLPSAVPSVNPIAVPTASPSLQPLCLWETNCALKGCERGSHCEVFQYWSQCQEDRLADINRGQCFSTNNGPFGGKRWGCSTSTDCCNTAATCGSNRLCSLSCAATRGYDVGGSPASDSKKQGVPLQDNSTVIAVVTIATVLIAAIALLYVYSRRSAIKKELNNKAKEGGRTDGDAMFHDMERVVVLEESNMMRDVTTTGPSVMV